MSLRKTQKLRQLLKGNAPLLVGGVYDGLSASIAERAGFQALWASGFCICASKGLADVGLISMSEHLSSTTEINISSSLPVVADVDDGFGDAINVVRMVRKYEAAGVAAICLEDNKHPKRNSLYAGVGRALVSKEEFALKIRAALDARTDPDFVVIARTEALVANMGLEEAMTRAKCYAEAGADMILIHCKDKTPDDVYEFGDRWDLDVPLVVVPTTYPSADADELFKRGYKMIIFANHGMRAAIGAMDQAYSEMIKKRSLNDLNAKVSPLSDVFSLVKYEEVNQISAQYINDSLDKKASLVEQVLFQNPVVNDQQMAVVYGDVEISYGKLKAEIAELAESLKKGGLRYGDRVAVIMPNSPEFIISFFAVTSLGGIVVPSDEKMPVDRLSFILKDTNPSFCLYKHDAPIELDTHIPMHGVQVCGEHIRIEPSFKASTRAPSETAVADNADALILYSAGSTGRPKGAVLKHKHLTAIANTLSKVIGMDSQHRDLILTTMTHSGGWQRVTSTILAGGCVHIYKGLLTIPGLVETLISKKISGFFTTPPFVRALLKSSPERFRGITGHFRSIEIASAPVSPEELASLRQLFPNINVYLQYGLTECSRAIILDTGEFQQKLHTVGRPTAGVEVQICSDSGQVLALGQEGEICLRAPQRTENYWNLPDLNLSKFREEWLLTGDYGSLDSEGFVTYKGRRDDMINCGGNSYFPAEIEFMLGEVEGVKSYIVAGVADPNKTMHDLPWIFVVPHQPDSWSKKDFLAYAKKKLPSHMTPRNVVIIPEVPLTHSGKPYRRRTLELYASQGAQ